MNETRLSQTVSEPDGKKRYTLTAAWLHWLLAIAIISVFVLGLYMVSLPFSPMKLKYFNWHKWAGVVILFLSAARLLWRISHRPPALSAAMTAAMPKWQQIAHHGVHHSFYLFFFAVPLIGWAYSSASGFPIVLFGVIPLPSFVPVSPDLAAAIHPWHKWSAFALAGLVVLHVLAVLKHQLVNKDQLLSRMRPW